MTKISHTLEKLSSKASEATKSCDYETAEYCYRQLAKGFPENHDYNRLYIESLVSQYKYDFAKKTLIRLLKKHKAQPLYLDLRARVGLLSGDFKQAERDVKSMLKNDPNSAELLQNLGHIYRDFGYKEKAAEVYTEALNLNPNLGQSYRQLKDLFKATEESDLDKTVQKDIEVGKRNHHEFLFGLGKLFDDLGNYADAWECYKVGNEIMDQAYKKHPIPNITEVGMKLRETTCRFIETHGTSPLGARINIVPVAGFPRSGTTMMEKVLSSDSNFKSCGELTLSGDAIKRIRASKENWNLLTEADISHFRNYYAQGIFNLKIGGKTGIDKGVTLFRSLGIFMLACEGIKAVQIKRDPMDTILSNFKAYFTTGQHYSYNIDEIIAYLKFYYTTTQCWEETFPDRIQTISYDSYVQSPDKHNKSLGDWLSEGKSSYDFDFSKRQGHTLTATANQLGDRIRTSSSGRSKAYKEYLAPWEVQIAELYQII